MVFSINLRHFSIDSITMPNFQQDINIPTRHFDTLKDKLTKYYISGSSFFLKKGKETKNEREKVKERKNGRKKERILKNATLQLYIQKNPHFGVQKRKCTVNLCHGDMFI